MQIYLTFSITTYSYHVNGSGIYFLLKLTNSITNVIKSIFVLLLKKIETLDRHYTNVKNIFRN